MREFKFLRGYKSKREETSDRWRQFLDENNIRQLINEHDLINQLEGNFNQPTQTFYGNEETIEMLR